MCTVMWCVDMWELCDVLLCNVLLCDVLSFAVLLCDALLSDVLWCDVLLLHCTLSITGKIASQLPLIRLNTKKEPPGKNLTSRWPIILISPRADAPAATCKVLLRVMPLGSCLEQREKPCLFRNKLPKRIQWPVLFPSYGQSPEKSWKPVDLYFPLEEWKEEQFL